MSYPDDLRNTANSFDNEAWSDTIEMDSGADGSSFDYEGLLGNIADNTQLVWGADGFSGRTTIGGVSVVYDRRHRFVQTPADPGTGSPFASSNLVTIGIVVLAIVLAIFLIKRR